MTLALAVTIGLIACISLILSPRARNAASFFGGATIQGQPPGLLTLTFSQVTTWIFARSLLNAAILGYYYGIWGALAYAAYYLSFITGGWIVDRVRFEQGFDSIQAFLKARFGATGTSCYNLVIGLRLISEVFANILVIAILFGVAGSVPYVVAVVAFAAVSLSYSMMGGLLASLRTDVMQMGLFLVTLVIVLAIALFDGHWSLEAMAFKPFVISDPGPVLLAVAFLQVLSYPMHDPVMMDRGFLADRETTRRSFRHAAWIATLCILAFGSLGVLAGAAAGEGEKMTQVLERLLGDLPMFLFNVALVISAMSTLDSTLSSSSKLVVRDMGLLEQTVANGRWVMLIFMLLGVGLVFLDNKDLFAAVAVSGTASLYLVPVIVFNIAMGRTDVPVWSYLVSFFVAMGAAILYFTESSGHSALLGEAHKYTKLLWLCLGVISVNLSVFSLGLMLSSKSDSEPRAAV